MPSDSAQDFIIYAYIVHKFVPYYTQLVKKKEERPLNANFAK